MALLNDDLTYFLEYVHLQLESRPIDGLRTWSERFTQSREEGRYDLCQRLLRAVKGYDLPAYGLGIVRYGEGWLHDRTGYWQEAIAAYEDSLKALHAAGMSKLDVELWNNIGSLYQDQGHWAKAERAYRQALAIAEQQDNQHGRAQVLNNLGNLYLAQNRNEEATGCFEEAIVS